MLKFVRKPEAEAARLAAEQVPNNTLIHNAVIHVLWQVMLHILG